MPVLAIQRLREGERRSGGYLLKEEGAEERKREGTGTNKKREGEREREEREKEGKGRRRTKDKEANEHRPRIRKVLFFLTLPQQEPLACAQHLQKVAGKVNRNINTGSIEATVVSENLLSCCLRIAGCRRSFAPCLYPLFCALNNERAAGRQTSGAGLRVVVPLCCPSTDENIKRVQYEISKFFFVSIFAYARVSW